MLKAIKFRLRPNKAQQVFLEKHAGCARFVYNYYLEKRIVQYEENKVSLSKNECITDLPSLKKKFTWLSEVDSATLQQSLIDLDKAYTNFFKHGFGYPKFKSKRNSKQSFRVTQSVKLFDNKIKLGKCGYIKIHKWKKELSRFPDKHVIKSATVSKDSDQNWYSSVLIECENQAQLEQNTNIVGIDLGIKNNYSLYYNQDNLFNFQTIDNPKGLAKYEAKLRRLNKSLSRKVKDSKNREKAKKLLARCYFKIKSIRKDFNHKLSKYLVNWFQMITIEDLDLEQMKKNRLGKKISDLAFYQFRTFLTYKCNWYGRHLSIVDRNFSSSKFCSTCKTKNDNLTLKDRQWTCASCNILHDRDENAAHNLWNAGIISWNTGTYNIKDCDYVTT